MNRQTTQLFFMITLLAIGLPGCWPWTKKEAAQEVKTKNGKKHALSDGNASGIPTTKDRKERKFFKEELGAYNADDEDGGEEETLLARHEIEGLEDAADFQKTAYTKSEGTFRKIYFDYDRKNIRDSEKVAVAYDAKAVQDACAEDQVEILAEGHCDDRYFNDDYNRVLSVERAKVAADEIAKKAGISRGKIRTVGYGSDRMAVNKPGQKEQLNRRVEFEVLKKQTA